MVAVIGYPGEAMHTWKRFKSKANALAWLEATGDAIATQHPARAHNAVASQRIIPEKRAAGEKYRDGRPCYPVDAEYECHAEQVS